MMKFLLLALLVAVASARVVHEKRVHGNHLIRENEDDTIDYWRELLDKILKQIMEKLEEGNFKIMELVKKAIEIIKKLKELHVGLGDKAKEIIDKIKEHFGAFWQKLLEALGLKSRVTLQRIDFESLLELLNLKEIAANIKELINGNATIEKIKEYINKALVHLTKIREALIAALDKGGLEGLKELINKIKELIGQNNRLIHNRGLKELWDKIINFFKELGLQIKDKYAALADFLLEHWNNAMEHAKDKLELIKIIAKEFIEHHNQVKEEVGRELLEFLKPYKDQLGDLWQQILDIVKGQDKRRKLH